MYLNRKNKNRIFHNKRCRKYSRKRTYYRKRNKKTKHRKQQVVVVTAPKVLDVFSETESTISFFGNVLNKIASCAIDSSLYFDLSAIETISPDAIMYLIAIISNNKHVRGYRIRCKGNLPKNDEARAMFCDTGFFDFVNSKSQAIGENSDYMKIQFGINNNPIVARNFCDFVDNSERGFLKTKKLFRMLNELMTNTYQHAYRGVNSNGARILSYWYTFAKNKGNLTQFVFLDTGLGIPKTVAKKVSETIQGFFSSKADAICLESALRGDYLRSETGLSYRGKGLPEIYNNCRTGSIRDLKIVSGRAMCEVTETNIQSSVLNSAFEGTLFSWSVLKGESNDNN